MIRGSAVLLAIIALASGLAPISAQAKSWRAAMAPGDVSKPHQEVEEQCERCHLVYKGVPNEKCLDCHTGLAARIDKSLGFHFTVKSRKCLDCHTDHHGRTSSLTRSEAHEGFDHAATGFKLEGAHAKPACTKCHDKPIEKVGAACAGCHADFHKGELGKKCEGCHAGAVAAASWKAAIKTKAAHKTPMNAGHEKPECKDCHKNGDHLQAKVSCGACHEQKHGGTNAACETCHQVSGFKPAKHDHKACTCKFPGKHITFDCLGCHPNWNFVNTPTLCSGCHLKQIKHEALGECSLCHSPFSWKRRDVFDHNKRSTFKLTDKHLNVDCARCHPVQGKFKGAPEKCEGCHQERGNTAHGDFGACDKCHSTAGFDKTTFDHASTGFPLSGRHVKLNCKDCHSGKTKGYPKPPKPVGWLPWPKSQSRAVLLALAEPPGQHGSDPACTHCHTDPHAGSAGTACLSCHTTEAWRPSTFDQARHQATRFPLEGKHKEVKCTLCHAGGQIANLPLDCKGCHLDIHSGRFGTDCKTCHAVTGFKPVTSFDHARTGFPLKGPHAPLVCDKCHAGTLGALVDKKIGEPASAAPGAEPRFPCATCHTPGHGAELGDKCDDCHSIEPDPKGKYRAFKDARGMPFPRHTETAFPLERRHTAIACRSCHPAQGPRPLPQCGICHKDPHAGQAGQACEECHRADRFSLVRFDHDRAGWPLRGRHFVTPCLRCHVNQRWVGLGTDCWDCHAKDAARAKMRVGMHPFGPLDCRDCHANPWKF